MSRFHVAFADSGGITPVLPIIQRALQDEPDSHFTLFYGERASSSVLLKEELENLKDRYLARFNLVFILSREQQDIELFNGHIDKDKCDRLLERWVDPADIDIAYLCGPQTMMDQVSGSLRAHGVAADRIRTDLVSAEKLPTPGSGALASGIARQGPDLLTAGGVASSPDPSVVSVTKSKVTLIRDGHTQDFLVARDTTLLESGLEQGIDMPYSCQGGVCSTCRCKLTHGKVEMDSNFALEDYEVARGFILTCQSYPTTDELVLDYDQES